MAGRRHPRACASGSRRPGRYLPGVDTATLTACINGTDAVIHVMVEITLGAEQPLVDRSLTVEGNGYTLNGGDLYRALFVKCGTVALRNMTIADGKAKGGNGVYGGGGGAGLGGGLFGYGGSVSLNNVSFQSNAAIGGDCGGSGTGGGGGFDSTCPSAPSFNDGATATRTVAEDGTDNSIGDLLDVTDTDSGETLPWTVASAPDHGSLEGFDATGTSNGGTVMRTGLTYAPDVDYDGPDSFAIQVFDGPFTDSITANVTVNDAPEVTAIDRGDPSPTNAASVTFDLAFSQSVANVGTGDFSLTGTLTGDISGVDGSDANWVVTVRGISGTGALGLELVGDDSINDGSGVPLGGVGTSGGGDGGFSGQTYTIDTVAPTVTVERATSQADPTSASSVHFTATFSEALDGFESGDVALGGSAGATTAVVTGTGPYDIAVSGMTGHGSVTAAIGPGVATDAVGKGNEASTSNDNRVQFYAASDLVINEVDYDQPGADDAELIELYNTGSTAIDLSLFEIRLVDSDGGTVYRTLDTLTGSLAAADCCVVWGDAANVADCDLDVPPDSDLVQDDVKAVALVVKSAGAVADALTWEGGLSANGDIYSEGDPGGADPAAAGDQREGLSRTSDGVDTRDNSTDFALRCITPGGANTTETDCTPVVRFSQAGPFSADEDAGTRSGFARVGSGVLVNRSGGTATAGTDYSSTGFPKTVTFAPGSSGETVAVTLIDDDLYETATDETTTLELGQAADATLGTPGTATLNIVDDEPLPDVTLGMTGSPLAECGGSATVTATLSHASVRIVTAHLGFSDHAKGGGVDYTVPGSSIVVAAGSLADTRAITGVDDALDKGEETVIVDISTVTNGFENGTQQVTAAITRADGGPTQTCVDDSLFANLT